MDHAAPGTAAWSHAMTGLTARRSAPVAGPVTDPCAIEFSICIYGTNPRHRKNMHTHFTSAHTFTASAFPSRQQNRHRKRVTTQNTHIQRLTQSLL